MRARQTILTNVQSVSLTKSHKVKSQEIAIISVIPGGTEDENKIV
jgi:hypothetical protein